MENYVKILGARGSVPVSGREYALFGGATTCVLVSLGGQTVLLDAGTGLAHLSGELLAQPELTLLLTHGHTDHLLGLSMFPYLFKKGNRLTAYADGNIREGLTRLISPPLWPLTLDEFPAEVAFHDTAPRFTLGNIEVAAAAGDHPGGVTHYRLTGDGKSVVFMTDTTIREEDEALLSFARGCSLLIIDGQYSDAEFAARSHYGHSPWTAAARFGLACGAEKILITHHDPSHGDGTLLAAEEAVKAIDPRCSFAREGETIDL